MDCSDVVQQDVATDDGMPEANGQWSCVECHSEQTGSPNDGCVYCDIEPYGYV